MSRLIYTYILLCNYNHTFFIFCLCLLPLWLKIINLLYYCKYEVIFYCWDMSCAMIPFLLNSITCPQATHQGKMESFPLYLCFPFIGFLLIRCWPTWIGFICLLYFCSYFQLLSPFYSIFWKLSQLYFLSILLHLKFLAIGPPALFACSFWKIPRTSCFSPPFWL